MPSLGNTMDERAKRRSIEREIWTLTGIIDHGLSNDKLQLVLKQFKRIDAVPTDYYQP